MAAFISLTKLSVWPSCCISASAVSRNELSKCSSMASSRCCRLPVHPSFVFARLWPGSLSNERARAGQPLQHPLRHTGHTKRKRRQSRI